MGNVKRSAVGRRRWAKPRVLLLFAVMLSLTMAAEGISQESKKPAPAKPVEKKAVTVKPSIGKPRTEKEFSKDIEQLLFDRRVAVSDLPGGVAFKARACMRCHENEPDVEGQIFYGNPDFKKDVNWPDYIGDAEKKIAPSLRYNFVQTHQKRTKLTPKGNPDQFMKQNQ